MYYTILKAFQEQYRRHFDQHGHTYYPQFRLEGRARDANNENNLEMCTADPLWMLGRQWQFGEFVGEDNGSPVEVNTLSLREQVSKVMLGNKSEEQSLGHHPLEALVEAIPYYPSDLKSQIKCSQQFMRLARQAVNNLDEIAVRRALQQAYPLRANNKLDRASQQLLRLSQGWAFNGVAMLQATMDNNTPFADLDQRVFAPLAGVWEAYKNWFTAKYFRSEHESTPAWDRERLLHNFTVSADGEEATISLRAPDYRQGELDWYSFDHVSEVNFKKRTPSYTKGEAHIPVRMRFPGMPNKRLFTFEDNHVNLGAMHIEEDDLLRMMLLDMALYASDDWYLIPFAMKTNEVAWISQLQVRDVFGVQTSVDNLYSRLHDTNQDGHITQVDVWDVFKNRDQLPTSQYSLAEHFLYAAPALAQRRESAPLEEVLFLRDEFANLVWAKEQRLANTVPQNWIPYVPRLPDDKHANGYLLRASVLGHDRQNIAPLSHLVKDELKVIRTEHIPRAGLRIQLTHQRARTANGKTYLWLGRKVLAGKGEGNSGLRFDYLEEKTGRDE